MSYKEIFDGVESSRNRGVNWYDRNPTSISKTFTNTGVAPHVITSRWTYTVPAGRKCQIEFVQIELVRKTVAAPVNTAFGYVTIAGASFLRAVMESNTIGERSNTVAGVGVILEAGDVIAGLTFDSSTGGTITYTLTLKGTEFDE